MERILLSTYTIHLEDYIQKNAGVISNEIDLFYVFVGFLHSLVSTIHGVKGKENAKHLTAETKPYIDPDGRCIYGYLSSGVSGNRYKIKDLKTTHEVLAVERDHAAFRNIFFYLSVSPDNKTGSLILQRRGRFGIKEVLATSLRRYLRQNNLGCSIDIRNILHGRVFETMMDMGQLRKINFIKHTLPATIEELFNNSGKANSEKGMVRTTVQAQAGWGLPNPFKDAIRKWMHKTEDMRNQLGSGAGAVKQLESETMKQLELDFVSHDNITLPPTKRWMQLANNSEADNQRIELEGLNDNYDEVEFELEVNGKRKTFYLYHREKVLPDIDVSKELKYIDDEPTVDSLVTQAEELIRDLIELKPFHADEN